MCFKLKTNYWLTIAIGIVAQHLSFSGTTLVTLGAKDLLAQPTALSNISPTPDPNAALFTEKHYVTSLQVVPSPDGSAHPTHVPEDDLDEQADSSEHLTPVPNIPANNAEWVTNTKNISYQQTNKHPKIKIFIAEKHLGQQLEIVLELLEKQRVNVTQVALVGSLKALKNPEVRQIAKAVAARVGDISILSVPPYSAKYSPVLEVSYDSTRLIYEGDFDLRAMFDKQGRFLRPKW